MLLALADQAIACRVEDLFLTSIMVCEECLKIEEVSLGERQIGFASERLAHIGQTSLEFAVLATHDRGRPSVSETGATFECRKQDVFFSLDMSS
jgi:hypothetical protein